MVSFDSNSIAAERSVKNSTVEQSFCQCLIFALFGCLASALGNVKCNERKGIEKVSRTCAVINETLSHASGISLVCLWVDGSSDDTFKGIKRH